MREKDDVVSYLFTKPDIISMSDICLSVVCKTCTNRSGT